MKPQTKKSRKKLAAVGGLVSYGLFAALVSCQSTPGFDRTYGPEPETTTPSKLQMNHAAHLEFDLACMDCHVGSEPDEVVLPTEAVCIDCHEEDTDRDEEEANCALCHGDATPTAAKAHFSSFDNLRFSHALHLGKEVDCLTCHRGMDVSAKVTSASAPTMTLCVECHEEQDASTDCQSCHTDLRNLRPRSHDQPKWADDVHGFESRLGGDVDMKLDCSACHTESSCNECHRREPPRDHVNNWRIMGHGIQASMDRTRCANCHREDFCDRCHQTRPPRTHRALRWGRPRNDHCTGCHLEPSALLAPQEGCGVCHKRNVGHALFAPRISLNAPHPTATACVTCHPGPGPSPKHPVNGDGAWCRTCHR